MRHIVGIIMFLVVLGSAYAFPTYGPHVQEPVSPIGYSSGGTYNISISWTAPEGQNISTVIFETNSTGSFANTTIDNTTPGIWSHTFTDLAAGTYSYRWYANDTLNEFNSTNLINYTIIKSSVPLEIQFDGSAGNQTASIGEIVLIESADGIVSDMTLFAYFKGTKEILDQSSNQVQYSLNTSELTLGKYNVTLNGTGNINYTADEIVRYLDVVDDESPIVTYTISKSLLNISESVTINYSATDNHNLTSLNLTIKPPTGNTTKYTNLAGGTIEYTNTSSIGTYQAEIVARDGSGNTETRKFNFTVSAPSSTFFTLNAGETRTVSTTGTAVTGVRITAISQIQGTVIVNPAIVPSNAPDGVVYQYFTVQLSGFDMTQISPFEILFTVPADWKSQNNIIGEVGLSGLRGEWSELPTTVSGGLYTSTSDSIYTTYAIVGERALPDPIVDEPVSEPEGDGFNFTPIIAGLIITPILVLIIVKRRLLSQLLRSFGSTIGMNIQRMKKPDSAKVSKRLTKLQDAMWKKISSGKDMGDAKINIDQAAISLKAGDVEAAEYYLFEAEKLIKRKK